MSQQNQPDFMRLYQRYTELKPGPKAELRRPAEPDDLAEMPAFYHLLNGHVGDRRMKRLIYCLPTVKNHVEGIRLGQALAKAEISEKRLFMVIRSEFPNDIIQLRRLLKMAEPSLDWPLMAETLYWWGQRNKQRILEDYFFFQNSKSDKSANPNAA
ncbi:type I-E CRISPR-associated protein Cse2/CasB [Oceanospirillum linum]|uniref:Type I-E CRISPR-associated protein Cse2/CasB n=1 Tax=Oceanospirillum linum TaxID=966 RepID=A0A1T1H8Y6_OCELI|nr:type I-E CRISPR-associated protein Cse2/CasB [Oceanospirillum linum]OOV86275.1 type I-E CRISPR-associated protein Cse2/CasB [Oceanospirillum linum]SEG52514.1 CRISPR-associated protein, Cse2 family [Oleiphilus messinensis]SMP30535.1 CRISPR-associated protein, Cse2 family [Oceanospirillum linum]